jgi:hypothetical protein
VVPSVTPESRFAIVDTRYRIRTGGMLDVTAASAMILGA